jgi:hypothetical protein
MSNDQVQHTATRLTADSAKSATENDLLIIHYHRHCDISVNVFPGTQLHINAEYYDLHPNHRDNVDGKYSHEYLQPGKKTFLFGPYEDTSRSLRVPYSSMRLWYLHLRGKADLRSVFDPKCKPTNSQESFLRYSNSHYIEFRKRAPLH